MSDYSSSFKSLFIFQILFNFQKALEFYREMYPLKILDHPKKMSHGPTCSIALGYDETP